MFGDLVVDKRDMSTPEQSTIDPFSHPLLIAAGCPSSANGAPVYFQQLIRSLQACHDLGTGANTEEWLGIVRSLSSVIGKHQRRPALSPTAADLKDQPWGSVHGCIEARSLVRNQSTKHLDALLGQLVLLATCKHQQLTESALHGFRTSYLALSGRRKLHAEWTLIATLEITNQSAIQKLLPGLTHPPVRAFAELALSILKQPMPTVAGLADSGDGHQSQASDFGDLNIHIERRESETLDISAGVHETHSPLNSNAKHSNFQRGDSVIGWHLKRSSNASRNDRLALDSWDSLPPEQTRRIASSISSLLLNSDSPWHPAAVVAISSLLTSTPAQILLHAKLNSEGDLNVDIVSQKFTWSIEMLLSNPPKTNPIASSMINIPFPDPLVEAIDGLTRNKNVDELQYFSDVFDVRPNTASWDVLLRQIHDLLRDLSEPDIQAFPGRWANSISRVYLEVLKTEMLSCVCSLDLALVPQAALHYFHPSEQDIEDAVAQLYKNLGFGSATISSSLSDVRNVVSDTALMTGFKEMEDRAAALQSEILKKSTSLSTSIHALNEFTQLTASMCIFLVGGRGSRVEEITCGALFCSDTEWWLEDKKIEHENSSRIVPKLSHQKHWLSRHFVAQQSVAERLSGFLRRDRSERWKELATGFLRFDAYAFELLTLESEKVSRTSVTARNIEAISRHYFRAGKNFMRHVLITKWGLGREDGNLLRLITGHSTAGLAVPAAGAIYTAESAVKAAGAVLEVILKPLLPTIDVPTDAQTSYRFVALPGRRILKVHSAYRDHLDTWSAIVFSRWHLGAVRIINQVRGLLLKGQGPSNPIARLWLHLITFDSVHEVYDLEAIFGALTSSFELSEAGWVMKICRTDSYHQLITPLQIPTALLISEIDINEFKPQNYLNVVDAAEQWLFEATPELWGRKMTGAADALLACSRLWSDWCLPSAVQLCYPQTSHAPVLDSVSNGHLFRLRSTQTTAPRPTKQNPQDASTDLFSTFFKVVNRLGSSRYKHGEQKKRAQLFSRWLNWAKLPPHGELACTLIQTVSINTSRIRAGKKNAIEWSSQATYLSSLRPFLTSMRNEDPETFDALDWHIFSTELISYAQSEDRQNVTASEAAQWILGCLRELGHPIPSNNDLTQSKRYPAATLTTAIAHITQEQLHTAIQLSTNDAITPLDCTRIQAAFNALSRLPLRWGELSAIAVNNLTSTGKLCITSAGYAHLKSHFSRRRLDLPPDLFDELQLLINQINALNTHGHEETTLLGSRRLKDGTVIQDSSWIRDAITWSVQIASSNSNFRIHAFRANFVTNTLLPAWQQAITTAKHGGAGPKDASANFLYNASRAWLTELVRLACGHASIRTTLSYYFHGWLLVRSIALHATLVNHEPTPYLLNKVGVSSAALIKARSRKANIHADPWQYLQLKLPKAVRTLKETSTPSTLNNDHTDQINKAYNTFEANPSPQKETKQNHSSRDHPSTHLTATRYLGLRLLGMDGTSATNLLNTLHTSTATNLETMLKLSNLSTEALRGRVKGDISGRAFKADINLLISDHANECFRALSGLPAGSLYSLLGLLLTKQQTINWPEEIADLAPRIANANFCLELVCDVKHVDPKMNLILSKSEAILIGSPAHDVGPLPRVFVQPKDIQHRNTVAKARWTTLIRILCASLRVLRSS